MSQNAIVIVGGGPAGVAAALELDRLVGEDISRPIYLFDRSTTHTYAPRLFDMLQDKSCGVYKIPFEDIFAGTRVRFLSEEVIKIDFELKRVITEKRQIIYSDIVLAIGSETNLEYAGKPWLVNTVDEVRLVKKELQGLTKVKGKHYFSVIGGGVRGIEASLAVMAWAHTHVAAAALPDFYLTLIQSGTKLAPELRPSTTAELMKIMKREGISIQLKKRRTWREHVAAQPRKADSPQHSALWATGLIPRALGRQKGVTQSRDGRIRVTATLSMEAHQSVWAAGSAASIAEASTPNAAWRQGVFAARAMVKSPTVSLQPYRPAAPEFLIPMNNRAMLRVTTDSIQAGIWVNWLAWWRDFTYLFRLVPIYQALDLLLKKGEM